MFYDLQNTIQKARDRAIRTPIKIGGELECSGRAGSSNPYQNKLTAKIKHVDI